MKIDILTIFPAYFESPLGQSLLGKAGDKGLVDVRLWDIRDYAADKHRTVDDEPYGGGPGMVMKIEPLCACLDAVETERGLGRRILLTPAGRVFRQPVAAELAGEAHLVFICGRYEGVDDRIMQFVDDELSIGDFVLMGGEAAALVVVEAVARLVGGVVGKEESVATETFAAGLIEYPQYTRPPVFRGYGVPDVLMSGDHGRVRRWRLRESVRRTLRRRPDLIETAELDGEVRRILDELREDDGAR